MAKKILLVDDDPDMLLAGEYGLKLKGYEVAVGRDGREALDLAARFLPDLVILDYHLPVMNGDEVVRALKKDEKLKRVPVFLMSASVEDLHAKSAACGADAWLNKPFDYDEFINLVNKYCGPGLPPPVAPR